MPALIFNVPNFFIFMSVIQCGYYSSGLADVLVEIREGDTLFFNSPESYKSLTSCSIVTPQQKEIMLRPFSNETARIKYQGRGLENGDCGAKVLDVQNSDNGYWTLQASDSSNKNKAGFNVSVLVQPHLKNNTILVKDGSVCNVACGPDEAVHCEMTSPENRVYVFDGPCLLRTYSPTFARDQGVWTCKFVQRAFLHEEQSYTALIVSPSIKSLDIGYNETDTSLNIYCNPVNSWPNYPDYCALTLPTGSRIYLGPGRGTDRYQFFGGNQSHCGISIQKPVIPDEIGSWECDFKLRGTPQHLGGYVTVNEARQVTQDSADKTSAKSFVMRPLEKIVYVAYGSQLKLGCHLNASLSYCWYRHPNGTVISGSTKGLFGKGLRFGYCSLDKYYATYFDIGEWTCSAGLAASYIQEISATLTVQVVNNKINVLSHRPNPSDLGKEVTVSCHEVSKQSLKYCRFVRPDGVGISLDEKLPEGEFYAYSGKGLRYGECGVRIKQIRTQDWGLWTCAFTDAEPMASETVVAIPVEADEGMSLSSSLGIGIGSAVAVLGIAFLVVVKYVLPRRNSNRLEATPLKDRSSPDEDTSDQLSTVDCSGTPTRRRATCGSRT